jgi:uncharacterized membrane protein (UPF0127 family)
MNDSPSFRVTNRRTGKLLGGDIRKAKSFQARFLGLLGRSSLAPGEGLWLEPCTSIHMFFMRFPIDAVFVDRASSVTRAVAGLAPWRVASGGRGAHAVLELPAGTILTSGTREGDLLEVTPAPRT